MSYVTKQLPKEHLRTLHWLFQYGETYLTKYAPGNRAERAAALADVMLLNLWIRENWPEAKDVISPTSTGES